jgi:hypothetical protein
MARKKATKKQPDNVTEMPEPTPRTADLPGVEGPGVAPKSIPEVEALADAYVIARNNRQRLTDKEVAAKERLTEALKEHADEIGRSAEGEIRYVYRGGEKDRRVITLKPSDEKLKVKDVEAFEE